MNTLRVLLIISTISLVSCEAEVYESCINLNGVTPEPVLNSPYSILPNGSICCPPLEGDSNCSSKKYMKTKCPDGLLIEEPCFFCQTCAKRLGEICGGMYGILGRCNKTMECTAHELTFLSGQNITGVCITKPTKGLGESCGGAYGKVGQCKAGFTCTADESKFVNGENVTGRCVASDAPDVCFKNCNEREKKDTCGSDGRIYMNKCDLRQQNCYLPHNSPDRVRLVKDINICEQSCQEISLQPWQKSHVEYTNGVNRGSEANFSCQPGYESSYDLHLKCNNRKWMEVLSDGNMSSDEWDGSIPFYCLPPSTVDYHFNFPS